MFEEEGKIKPANKLDDTTIENSVLGLKTIRKRSIGLSKFVETYKSLTQIPKPNFTEIKTNQFFMHIQTLMQDELNNNGIKLKCNTDSQEFVIKADEKLIEQVIINLIKNSVQALSETENPEITIDAIKINEHIQIQVIDNGAGISPEVLDNIFIPFFTTKEKGSGIGLSLSRQIMHLHGGNITVKSEPNVETVFTLIF
jgi:signal transduction histidine kinase